MVIHKDMYDKDKQTTVLVSGGFDPVHVGHIRMIREASKYGGVIVIANSDDWLHDKKGFMFMDFKARHEILDAIKGVILVDSVDDSDGTVCDALRRHRPTYFANGGDRGKDNTPEVLLCKELGIELLWGIGGEEKVESSSDLVKKVQENEPPMTRVKPKQSSR